ncbi:MAG: hypothetical protein V3T90_15420, partial [Anaerolineae bacterium]
MNRGLTLTLAIGVGLLLVTLSVMALQWESPLALAAGTPISLEQTSPNPNLVGVAAYEGTTYWQAMSSVCYFPFAQHNPGGWSTRLYFQNASWWTASVTISLYSGIGSDGDPTVVVRDVVVPPNARGVYPVSDLVTGVFTGAAVIESDQPLACSAEILNESDPAVDMMIYRTPEGGSESIAPQVRKEGAGAWNSRIVVFNHGGPSNDVYIRFYDRAGMDNGSVHLVLDDHDTWVYDVLVDNTLLPLGFEGWAHITGTLPIAVVVLNEADGKAVALTPWEGMPSCEAVLPWVERGDLPPTQIALYNFSDVSQISRTLDFHFAGDGSLDNREVHPLGARERVIRSLEDVSLPGDWWHGSVRSTGLETAGMVAFSDWGTAAAGYSSLEGYSGYDFFVPNIVRYPDRYTAFTVWSHEPLNLVTVEFYDLEGKQVFSYTGEITRHVGLRFDQGMMPDLGPTFEGSAHVFAHMDIAVVVEEMVVGLPPMEDSYEPNDSDADAYTIAAGVSITSFISHPDDPDWYKFEIEDPSLLTVTLDQLPADYDLVLFTDLIEPSQVPASQVMGELAD